MTETVSLECTKMTTVLSSSIVGVFQYPLVSGTGQRKFSKFESVKIDGKEVHFQYLKRGTNALLGQCQLLCCVWIC